MQSNELKLQRIYTIWGLVLILWSLYRANVNAGEAIDEFVFKPLIFVIPVLLYVKLKEKRVFASVGLTLGNFFRDIYLGVGFGMLFALEGIVANAVKYGRFSFAPVVPLAGTNLYLAMALALVSAFSEEFLVRGFIFTRLNEYYRNELKAMFTSTVMYFFLLIPAIFLVTRLNGVSLLLFVFTNLLLSLANTMIFSETRTLTVPVLLHAFWNMAVALYL